MVMESQATDNITTHHEDHTVPSRSQDDPWKLKIVLTLDGGGVRGYGSLLMLQALMEEIRRIERDSPDRHDSSFDPYEKPPSLRSRNMSESTTSVPERMERSRTDTNRSTHPSPVRDQSPANSSLKPSFADYLPCHYFDFIGGTSTGGLNAIMLGRLRMSADQCVQNYPSMASNIFSNARLQFKGWPRNKYDAKVLEDAIDKIVQLRTDGKKGHLATFESPDDLCRTFVIAKRILDGNGEDPHIFRSYKNDGTPGTRSKPISHGEASRGQIWEIGRATAAAPTYFKPQKIGEDFYSDGGLGYNNPAEEAYWEILHKEGAAPIPINLFLSIGTGGDDDNDHSREHTGSLSNLQAQNGTPPAPEPLTNGNKKTKRKKSFLMKHLSNLGERLQKEVAEAKKVDRHMRGMSTREGWHYFRWTGGRDLAKLKLDKWEPAKPGRSGTQCDIENWVKKYMESPARQEEIRQIAEIAVQVRRQRIQYDNGDRWQRFTYCSWFRCPICNTEVHGTRAQLAEHIRGCDVGVEHNTSRYARIPPQVNGGPW